MVFLCFSRVKILHAAPLNMNSAFSCLCVNEWRRHGFRLLHTYWNICDDFSLAASIWVHKHMNIVPTTALSHFMSILPFLLRKPIVISYEQRKLLKHSTFLEIGSFYNSPRVKQLSFTIFESIQPISGSGGSTFSNRSLNLIRPLAFGHQKWPKSLIFFS